MPCQVYQPSRPEAEEDVLPQELELVRLAEPEGLRANPHARQLQRTSGRDGQLRYEQRQEERVPQEVLREHVSRLSRDNASNSPSTYLRRADLVEDDEHERLHEPREYEVLSALPEEQAGTE